MPATVAPPPMAHALPMPARATAARRWCSSMSAGVGAARPRLANAYTSHCSSPRVLPHARARQRSSPRVLSKWLNGSNGRRRRGMGVQVLKVLNASNICDALKSTGNSTHDVFKLTRHASFSCEVISSIPLQLPCRKDVADVGTDDGNTPYS
ncbi:hypothetical protein ACQJBY_059189 [Aegilops geniculata]